MFYLAIGAPGSGKSYLVRSWLLPALLHSPAEITSLAPAGGFRVALIDDPTRGMTGAQYQGQRFEDVAEFRRAKRREVLSCFERANYDELMRLATECRGAILVFDEAARAFPAQAGRLSEIKERIVTEGRHYGVCVVGCGLKLHKIHADARNTTQGLFLSDLSEPRDRKYASEMIRRPGLLDRITLGSRQFLQWSREDGSLFLIRIVNGRRVIDERL